MAASVQLGQVRTWYDEHGQGDPLVLLHPEGPTRERSAPTSAHFRVLTPGTAGPRPHPDVDGPITYDLMAADTIAFLEAMVPGASHGLLVEKPALCNAILVDFLTTDPVPALAPIRRAARP